MTEKLATGLRILHSVSRLWLWALPIGKERKRIKYIKGFRQNRRLKSYPEIHWIAIPLPRTRNCKNGLKLTLGLYEFEFEFVFCKIETLLVSSLAASLQLKGTIDALKAIPITLFLSKLGQFHHSLFFLW